MLIEATDVETAEIMISKFIVSEKTYIYILYMFKIFKIIKILKIIKNINTIFS